MGKLLCISVFYHRCKKFHHASWTSQFISHSILRGNLIEVVVIQRAWLRFSLGREVIYFEIVQQSVIQFLPTFAVTLFMALNWIVNNDVQLIIQSGLLFKTSVINSPLFMIVAWLQLLSTMSTRVAYFRILCIFVFTLYRTPLLRIHSRPCTNHWQTLDI